MLRFQPILFTVSLALLISTTPLAVAKPRDRASALAKLQHDLDRAMPRGTPTDKEIAILKKSRMELNSTNMEEFDTAIDNIDRIAHTQSFKPQDASDIRKDIGEIKGRWSFLPLHKK